MTQHVSTIIKPIKPIYANDVEALKALREHLRVIGDNVQAGLDTRFHRIPDLHFLSCCILEQTKERSGWFLVLELSFDGDVRPFLEWVVNHQRATLDELLSSCEGYPAPGANSREVVDYLLDSTPAQAVYIGTPARSRRQIEDETGLRKRIAARLDKTAGLAMSRAQRWQEVVAGIYAESPELRTVPKRPLRVRLNPADPTVRARLAAAGRIGAGTILWIAGVAAAFVLARTAWQRALVLTPPLALGVWATGVFIRLSPGGLVRRVRVRVWGQAIRDGARTALYVAPAGGLVLAAGVLEPAGVGRVLLVTSGALLAVLTIALSSATVFSMFGGVATAAAAIVETALLWWFPRAIVPAFVGTVTIVAALLFVFAWRIRRLEANSKVWDEQDSLNHLRAVTRREYQQLQTHLASETDIAQDTFRMRTLCSVLRWVNGLSWLFFNQGHLDKITSIHFARFIVPPGRRTLLFLSNYDGRFEDYLGAFSTVTGVTAVWGNTAGFPRPFLLVFDGARAENHFKRYARASQVESLVWFSAYPNLSVAEIDRATYLREALAQPIDRHGAGVIAAVGRVLRPTLDEQTLVYLMDGR